jgi:Tol biopolymer transport system component
MGARAIWLSALVALLLVLAVFLALAPPAHAAFPGANGKIAFVRGSTTDSWNEALFEIYVVNGDGATGLTRLTNNSVGDTAPAWSPDGTQIAFASLRDDPDGCDVGACNWEIYVMNADGTNVRRLTNNVATDIYPAWSPDGTRIVFDRQTAVNDEEIDLINADGSGLTTLATNAGYCCSNEPQPTVAGNPAWSPDGQKIAYRGVWLMNPDGTGQARLSATSGDDPNWSPDGQWLVFRRGVADTETGDGAGLMLIKRNGSSEHQIISESSYWEDLYPAWSPDGTKIVFDRSDPCCPLSLELWMVNPDGTNTHALGSSFDFSPDWQPLPSASYHHPQSASQLNVSLVPAFKPCGTGGNPSNAKHAPPLATNSCNPPKPSVLAAVGGSSQSSAQMTVVPGDTDPTNGNQANVAISASLTDIQSTAGGDYNPNASGADLTAVTRLRLTDKANGYGGLPATATEYDFKVPIDCSSTPDPSVGSTCSANTTANALMPSLIQEQRQTVVQAFRVRIDDSGANGIRGDSDDRIFATQGLFVP